MSRPAVHQVLATLGYGDAIGNEVLGIRRVLQAAGYESEIFVETADSRLESLTADYRDLPDASHPDNILLHHFSLGSKASRIDSPISVTRISVAERATNGESTSQSLPRLAESSDWSINSPQLGVGGGRPYPR